MRDDEDGTSDSKSETPSPFVASKPDLDKLISWPRQKRTKVERQLDGELASSLSLTPTLNTSSSSSSSSTGIASMDE